jgi:hypothetical protein
MPFKLKNWIWLFRHEPVSDHTRNGTGQVFESAWLCRRPAARKSFGPPAFGFEKNSGGSDSHRLRLGSRVDFADFEGRRIHAGRFFELALIFGRARNAERLEQLRALENGIQIAVVKVDYDSVSVDVPVDVAKVEKIISHG